LEVGYRKKLRESRQTDAWDPRVASLPVQTFGFSNSSASLKVPLEAAEAC